MGKPTGFMEFPREAPSYRPTPVRLGDYLEVYEPFPDSKLKIQGARCMDCGIPFCHQGCPLGNLIPDWNDLVYKNQWREAINRLHATNNFPEFTGRLCPAPCETACVLGINEDPVTIKQIELAIVERGFEEGYIEPQPPTKTTGKKVAVVGSGPAGLACAQQLARAGHEVVVFERAERIGGLLRFGIPDFKMEKWVIDRRMQQMEAEGVTFRTNCNVGKDITGEQLQAEFDAIVLCGGATAPRDLKIPGRELNGIHFAMEYLPQQNQRNYGRKVPDGESISAEGKHVIIIGGGDTGADCLGTAHRQRCASIHQFEIVPEPPGNRDEMSNPWPQWSNILRTSSAHKEGGERVFSINTKRFIGESGRVTALETTDVNMVIEKGRPNFVDIPGTTRTYKADLVLLAMGFAGPEPRGILEQLGVSTDRFTNVTSDGDKMTNVPGVFTAGDMTRGQSLIVWAIAEGRHAAHGVDKYLMGASDLPKPLEFGNGLRPFS